MIEYEVGEIVISKAGHDKGEHFVIVKSDSEYVYLVDGVFRTVDRPKKKNKKHVQLVHFKDSNVIKKYVNNEKITNEEIKRAIKLFKDLKS
ncbi:MAG: KOW domain-containing RNA-binding protein [Anaerocolumna aminovalerica]|jgi:ribosomal protein L14E/L6E/L27E|uniref:KOW domain-containing RNA-binding protein n=1 Tax=Anaerocolumna aminovalerica TaxID=1527 RepID=UPI00209CC08A|nr:KOW domain-containing RNA-binding protein [Anaerocolumna aminovalerica]MDU6263643.1 KOW domain-containing RNA-binding protein [Anaerocolumna aminovalerica]